MEPDGICAFETVELQDPARYASAPHSVHAWVPSRSSDAVAPGAANIYVFDGDAWRPLTEEEAP